MQQRDWAQDRGHGETQFGLWPRKPLLRMFHWILTHDTLLQAQWIREICQTLPSRIYLWEWDGDCSSKKLAGLTGIDDHTRNGRSVSPNPFRCRMYNNVGSMLDGADKIPCKSKLWQTLVATREYKPPIPNVLSTMRGIPWSWATWVIGIRNDPTQSYKWFHLWKSRDVEDMIFRIGDALNKYGFRLLVNSSSKGFWTCLGDPLNTNTEVLEGHCEWLV